MILHLSLTAITLTAVGLGTVSAWMAAEATSQRDQAIDRADWLQGQLRLWQSRARVAADRRQIFPATWPVDAPALPAPARPELARPLEIPTGWPDPPVLDLPPLDPDVDDVTVEGELLPLLPDGMPRTAGPNRLTPDLHTHPPAPIVPVPPVDRRRRRLPLIGTRT